MKKYAFLALLCMTSGTCMAASNPMFGPGTQNSVALRVTQGVGGGTLLKLIQPGLWDIGPMTNIMAEYSQPVEIFRLPSRINLTYTQNIGYNSARGLSFMGVGVSWDIAIFQWRGFYFGGGLGPYMRNKTDRWIASRLVFGERVFIGKNFGKNWRGEIFTEHFSNGSFTEPNRGFNYSGLSVSYSF